jgi:NADH:ubiquinone oxidoreductase subunit H
VSARFRHLFYGVSSKNVLSAVVSFSLLSAWKWLFTPVSIFTLFSSVSSGLVLLSSLFLLYVERKVIGACQNRHCIVSFSP